MAHQGHPPFLSRDSARLCLYPEYVLGRENVSVLTNLQTNTNGILSSNQTEALVTHTGET